jgi:putative transposase
VLRVGDCVRFGGCEHTVVALSGASVRLVDDAGAASVVLLVHLLASDGFKVLATGPGRLAVSAADALDGLPAKAVERAEWWRGHLEELLTGRRLDQPDSVVRAEYDPMTRTLRQRELAKLDELRSLGEPVGQTTLRRMRGRFEREGIAGLVDRRLLGHRAGTGRADSRVVAAIEAVVDAQTGRSTVSGSVLMRRVERRLAAEHAEAVEMPSRATFYRLLDVVSTGRHTLGSARTRRSLAKQPKRMFGQLTAARPGEVMEIDSTPLDVLVVHDDGTVDTCELTALVDLATRTIAAAVLRPSTKAVDAALLLARAMTPEPMRPGWADALRLSRSVLPHAALTAVDERLEKAAAVPVIVPETVVSDHGKAFFSNNFRQACRSLGISVELAHPDTPTDKPHIERTLGSVATMFTQYLAGHKGRSIEMRGKDPAVEAVWSIHQVQEMLQEWIIARWQTRPHDGLRDPLMPGRPLSPNEKYAALVAAAGCVSVTLTEDEYVALMPSLRRTINTYGIKVNNRVYDSRKLDSFRRQPAGLRAGAGQGWDVRHDPYDISRVWIRDPRGEGCWIPVFWRHLSTAPMPMGELVWQHSQRMLAERGQDKATEQEIAAAAAALLDRAADGPREPGSTAKSRRRDRKVAARTRATAGEGPGLPQDEPSPVLDDEEDVELAEVVPLQLFDARKEAERWR